MSNRKKLVAIVPVRAGSKGLVNKNIKLLNGLPLYMHSLLQGERCADEVVITTDISDIRQDELSEKCKLHVRPSNLAKDDALMSDVIIDVIKCFDISMCNILLLQATSPLRTDEDILSAVELFESSSYDLVMTVVEVTPDILKCGVFEGSKFIALREPTDCFANRQSLPVVCKPNGAAYVFAADQFINASGFPSGNIGAIKMPAIRSVDIDTLDDFNECERIMKEINKK